MTIVWIPHFRHFSFRSLVEYKLIPKHIGMGGAARRRKTSTSLVERSTVPLRKLLSKLWAIIFRFDVKVGSCFLRSLNFDSNSDKTCFDDSYRRCNSFITECNLREAPYWQFQSGVNLRDGRVILSEITTSFIIAKFEESTSLIVFSLVFSFREKITEKGFKRFPIQ